MEHSVSARTYGVRSMTAPLRRALLVRPPEGGDFIAAGWRSEPDVDALRAEHAPSGAATGRTVTHTASWRSCSPWEGVAVERFDLPHHLGRDHVMHLLSVVSPLDEDLALVHEPGVLVVAEGNPRTRRALERAGCEAHVYRALELNKGDGGPTCLTRPVLRGR